MSDLRQRDAGEREAAGEAFPGLAAAVKCLALDVVAAQTCSLLTDAGVPAMLIKGPVTAHLLYPDDPDRRTYTDVDILVPADRFHDAEALLRDNGYDPLLAGLRDGEFPSHESAWRSKSAGGMTIDLHRGFAGVHVPNCFFAGLWDSRSQLELCGTMVFVPNRVANLLILMLHAANPGRSDKPLSDLRRAREAIGLEVWRAAADLAIACGASSGCRAGLSLLPDGITLADSLGLRGTITADQWIASRPSRSGGDRIRLNLSRALTRPGFRATSFYLIGRILPSPESIRLHDSRAASGNAHLALAYVRRILRVVAAAPLATLDALAARRATLSRVPRWQLVRPALSAVDGRSIQAAAWSWLSFVKVRRQLRRNGLQGLDFPPPQSVRPRDRSAVWAVLRMTRATCLERSVVLQRFDAAAGRPRSLVIAVTAPGAQFRAHAWLDGDRQPDSDLLEIHRWPAPAC